MAHRNAYAGTQITTEINIGQSLKTLVLKLKPLANVASNNTTSGGYIDEMIDDIETMLANKTSELQKRIKQARPSVSDPQYEAKMKAYLTLLRSAQPLFVGMQESFGEVLDYFHAFINDLWADITNNQSRNSDKLLQDYTEKINNCMNGRWSQYFKQIEQKIAMIK